MAAKNDNLLSNPSEKGRIGGLKNKGRLKNKTLIKEKLGLDNIEDMKEDVIRVWHECINSNNSKDKQFAAKEMSKYIFPQKRELSGELKEKIEITIVDYTE